MSWILTREKDNIRQIYRDADIYGRGKWEGDDCPWWHFPEQYTSWTKALIRMSQESIQDPDWEYKISYYE